MKIVMKSQITDAQLVLQRPNGMNFGLQLIVSKGDGEPPVIDMELSQTQAEALERAIGLFT